MPKRAAPIPSVSAGSVSMAPTAAVPGVLLSLLLLGGVALEVELSEPVDVNMPAVMAGMLVVLVVPLLSVPLRHALRKITETLALLVKVQVMFEPGAVAKASSVSVLPDNVAAPPGPVPVQAAETSVKPAVAASLIVVMVLSAVRIRVAPLAATPAVVVLIGRAGAALFDPVKLKAPVPPFDIFETVTRALTVLVIVQTTLAAVPVLPPPTKKKASVPGGAPPMPIGQLVDVV